MTRHGRTGRWAFGLALVVAAVNLRPAITSLSPLMPELGASYGLTEVTTVLVVALPVLVLGVGSLLAPALAGRLGTRQAVAAGLLAVSLGIALRSVWRPAVFPGTALAALGITVVAVMLPVVVRERGVATAGAWTALYSVALAVGAAAAPAVSGFLADRGVAVGVSTGAWAGVALASAVVWARAVREPGHTTGGPTYTRVVPDSAAWFVAGLFSVQALLFFAIVTWLPRFARDAGTTVAGAGAVLGLFSVVGCVGGLLVPLLAARLRSRVPLLLGLSAVAAAGFAMLAAGGPPALGALLLGIGQAAVFPLALTLFVLRAADSAVAATLSTFAQCTGFTVAALGLLVLGLVHEAAPAWPLFWSLLAGLSVLQALVGVRAASAEPIHPSPRTRGHQPEAVSAPQEALTQGVVR